MNNETMELLEKHFDIAFAAPDGVKKLRELILTLAMQGKLVPQDPNDQPASKLLKAIEVEKKRLVKEGKIKQPKLLPHIKSDEVPYALPKLWQWVQLNDLSAKIHYGYTASANLDVTDVRLLRITDIQESKVDWESVPGCEIKEKDIPQYLLANNDILIARTGGTVGKSYLVKNINVNAVFASYLIRVVPSALIDVNYLKFFLEGPLYWKQLYAKCSGTGQPNVNGTALSTLWLSLPPLAEQHRIVAKIDQLMARCDELEKLRAEREQKRITVHTAALNRLLMAKESSDFSTAWRFITQHFGELYSVKENVTELRKAILQLAVMGKLVPQDPKDQPVSELLKEIEAEKQRLVKEGKIKQPKPLPEIEQEGVPYELPKGWKWVRVIDIVDVGTGSTPATTNPEYYNGRIPWYTSSATNNSVAEIPETFITESAIRETNCKIFPSGSLIIAMYGQGKTRGQISEIVIPGATNQAIAAMVFYESSRDIKHYIKYYFVKIYDEIRSIAEGAAQPNLNVGKIKETLIPLPPLAEQHRIVAKIDQLMAFCDHLEQKIDGTTSKRSALLNALLAQV
jgi:type I restriction enzyme, S subunit